MKATCIFLRGAVSERKTLLLVLQFLRHKFDHRIIWLVLRLRKRTLSLPIPRASNLRENRCRRNLNARREVIIKFTASLTAARGIREKEREESGLYFVVCHSSPSASLVSPFQTVRPRPRPQRPSPGSSRTVGRGILGFRPLNFSASVST